MKANELMVGDWVYCFDPDEPDDKQINKVSAIRLEYNEGSIKFEQFSDWFEEGWFAPIPLTAEILEKNGFELITDDTFRNDDGVGVSFENEEKFPAIFTFLGEEDKTYMELIYPNGHIIHVHELQHALRLCGLTELADNFKVE